jgi:mono/diheme cytochrome c family protein
MSTNDRRATVQAAKSPLLSLLFLGMTCLMVQAQGQRGPAPEGNRGAPQGRGQRSDYPSRAAADPAVLERGKQLFGLHCAFCHGQDARGGSEGGPNLIRSDIVLNDKNGERITPIVQNGRGAMPKIDVTPAQVADIAVFIHSFPVGGRDPARELPRTILVGDSKAGEKVFAARCASCHSVTGDLKGFGARGSDPTALQQAWLMPAGGRGGRGGITDVPPTTATVTLPSGQKIEGRLMRIDDFIVSLQLSDESNRSFTRKGNSPKVEVHDPMETHKTLLRSYTDKEIHDLTAYLVTIR